MIRETYYGEYIWVDMPLEVARAMTGPGDKLEAAQFWARHPDVTVSNHYPLEEREAMIRELVSTGGWEAEELTSSTPQKLRELLVWVAGVSIASEVWNAS